MDSIHSYCFHSTFVRSISSNILPRFELEAKDTGTLFANICCINSFLPLGLGRMVDLLALSNYCCMVHVCFYRYNILLLFQKHFESPKSGIVENILAGEGCISLCCFFYLYPYSSAKVFLISVGNTSKNLKQFMLPNWRQDFKLFLLLQLGTTTTS